MRDKREWFNPYRNKESLFAENLLPDRPPNPHITFPIEDVKRFNDDLKTLGLFVSNILGVKFEELCMAHMMWKENKYDKLQSRLDMAVECLKFYAAEENWEFTSDFHGHESYEEIKDDEECTAPCMSYGGKRAREVLKQINPKGG